jgi:predicted DNA-binding transcriptional regulator YafY
MRRADRLFRIVEYLKARRQAVTALAIAKELDVSVRTIYRDIADLIASGTPIHGSAGVGYLLDRQHVLRPIMFSAEELDALMLGAQMLQSYSDRQLAAVSRRALDKIHAVLPEKLYEATRASFLFAFPSKSEPPISFDVGELREAIGSRRIVRFSYTNEAGKSSGRNVRPLSLAFFAPVWLLLGWCETRKDFRNFRLDRIDGLVVTDGRFRDEKGRTLADYVATLPHSAREAMLP